MYLIEALNDWNENIKPVLIEAYGENDAPALAESWNDHLDILHRDDMLTNLQVHFAPSWDDTATPDRDDEFDYLLQCMGVTFRAEQISDRTIPALGDEWPEGTAHYMCHLSRGVHCLSFEYSKGPGIADEAPERTEVINCLLGDRDLYYEIDGNIDEFIENCSGFDNVEEITVGEYRRWQERLSALTEQVIMLEAMFDRRELEDLQQAAEDY